MRRLPLDRRTRVVGEASFLSFAICSATRYFFLFTFSLVLASFFSLSQPILCSMLPLQFAMPLVASFCSCLSLVSLPLAADLVPHDPFAVC
jgi:hypothetical protein